MIFSNSSLSRNLVLLSLLLNLCHIRFRVIFEFIVLMYTFISFPSGSLDYFILHLQISYLFTMGELYVRRYHIFTLVDIFLKLRLQIYIRNYMNYMNMFMYFKLCACYLKMIQSDDHLTYK